MSIQKPRCRVLVVEDEASISILIEDMLVDFGTEIVGPAARIEEALRLADEEELDLAILDINLSGQATYPVAEVLGARGIPFVFATGYNTAAVPDQFRNSPTLQKPFSFRSFEDTSEESLGWPSLSPRARLNGVRDHSSKGLCARCSNKIDGNNRLESDPGLADNLVAAARDGYFDSHSGEFSVETDDCRSERQRYALQSR